MNMRKLLDLMEATPRQGVTGQKLAQTSGGQFMNRADRTNQAKVDAALGGAINPATGKPYVAGRADTNLALAKKFSQPQAANNASAPSADNEQLKGATIAKAMSNQQAAVPAADTTVASADSGLGPEPKRPGAPTTLGGAADEVIATAPANTNVAAVAKPQAANPGTPAAGIAFNQGAASANTNVAAVTKTQPATQAANPGTPAAGIAFNQGAASQSSPTTTTAASTPDSTQPKLMTPDERTAAATAARPAGGYGNFTQPTQTAQAAEPAAEPTPVTPTDTTASSRPAGGYGRFTEEELEEETQMELEEMMRLSGLALSEKAPPGKKAERMVKHIKKGYAKDGKLTDKEKSIAYATAWKQHNKEKVNEGMDIMLDEEGHTLKHIVNRFKHETKNFMDSGFMAENLYDALYDYYLDRGDMPYGIAKAREGDPYEWVAEHFYHDMGSQMSEGAVAEQTVDPLSELARLAGLSEDGPGASRLYTRDKSGMGVVPKDTPKDPGMSVEPKDTLKDPGMGVVPKEKSLKDKMSANEGLSDITDTAIDTAKSIANKGIDWYNKREQEKKDYWDSIKWADGSGGKPGASGTTADLLPRFKTNSDTRLADKDKTPAPIATPAATKADAFGHALDAASGQKKAQADDKLKEWGDSPLNRINQMPQTKGQEPSSGAASSFAPRERERVVSPKIDKYDREKERAEKARRDIVDRESPDANTFGRKIGKAVSEPIAAVKSAWHGATDAWDHTMGNDTAPDPKPPVSVVNKRDWKGDKDNPALKENDELNRMRKIAGLQECGDMGMDSHNMQKDRLNVTTNMSSDGTRDVTINAQGDAAEDLLSMLKLAGMERSAKPTMVMIDQDEEMMEADRVSEYENTPEEEYQSVDSIIRQGNDLNREKRQYADKPKLGDNPMAESILDQDLNDILESILIRDDKDEPEIKRDPESGRVSATFPAPKRREPNSQEIPMEPESPESRTTGPRSMKVPGERTGTEKEVDEGWEDVSNFFGDLMGTEASQLRHSDQLRQLDAMRQQYKGTPYEKQVQDRYDAHLERRQQDKGEVVDKKGEPIKVLPPDQWKGGKQ